MCILRAHPIRLWLAWESIGSWNQTLGFSVILRVSYRTLSFYRRTLRYLKVPTLRSYGTYRTFYPERKKIYVAKNKNKKRKRKTSEQFIPSTPTLPTLPGSLPVGMLLHHGTVNVHQAPFCPPRP